MKAPKFKNPDQFINFGGRQIGPHNITVEIYNELVQVSPAIADFFEPMEEEKQPGKSGKSKTEEQG